MELVIRNQYDYIEHIGLSWVGEYLSYYSIGTYILILYLHCILHTFSAIFINGICIQSI